MRTVTGAIGNDSPDAFKVNTAVATIGIRGTGFDLLWAGTCTGPGGGCGLLGFVWEGDITSDNDAGVFDILLNQIARIRDRTTPPEFITTPPVFIVPRPDTVDIDMDELFGDEDDEEELPAGLYVACYEGECSLTDDGEEDDLDIGNGEMGYVAEDNGELVLYEVIDAFIEEDVFFAVLNEEAFDEIVLYELIGDTTLAQNEFECYIQ